MTELTDGRVESAAWAAKASIKMISKMRLAATTTATGDLGRRDDATRGCFITVAGLRYACEAYAERNKDGNQLTCLLFCALRCKLRRKKQSCTWARSTITTSVKVAVSAH